jgi:hypothetical protein
MIPVFFNEQLIVLAECIASSDAGLEPDQSDALTTPVCVCPMAETIRA